MTIDGAIQILNLYDLGNVFLDIDGNPISHEKMSSACDMAVEALNLKNRILERKSYLYYKDNPTEAEKAEYYALVRLLEAENADSD